MILSHEVGDEPSTEVSVEVLRPAVARHSKPEAVRTDRGSAILAFTRESDFAKVLEAEFVDLISKSCSSRCRTSTGATSTCSTACWSRRRRPLNGPEVHEQVPRGRRAWAQMVTNPTLGASFPHPVIDALLDAYRHGARMAHAAIERRSDLDPGSLEQVATYNPRAQQALWVFRATCRIRRQLVEEHHIPQLVTGHLAEHEVLRSTLER